MTAGNNSKNYQVAGNLTVNQANLPTELIDKQIIEEVENLRKSCLFSEFDQIRSSHILGRRLEDGDFSGGSNEKRSIGLVWCVRILSVSDELEQAERYLALAETLGDFPEIEIAAAFVISIKEGKTAAIKALAGVSSSSARSAAWVIVAHHDGAEKALEWMASVDRTANCLDSDGKSLLLLQLVNLGLWGQAEKIVHDLSGADFEESPIFNHLAAMITLGSVVPVEFRASAIAQVPFDLRGFPLSSDEGSMDARRRSHQHFLAGVKVAEELGCPLAAKLNDEYALWLELVDPEFSEHGKTRLQEKLRDPDPEVALGFVHYAFQFNIRIDLDEVERNIDRSIALHGDTTVDAAHARLAMLLNRTPAEAANYFVRHREQLEAHIDTKMMQVQLIRTLACNGLVDRANDIFIELLEAGITGEQESDLRSAISDAQEHDPIVSHKNKYDTTEHLDDLLILVAELERHQRWDDLCKFGRMLFDRTHSLGDAERLVNALNEEQNSEGVVVFLKENHGLLPQSKHLRMSYAWGLYHEGLFLESLSALSTLSQERGAPNYHELKVKLGISMGDQSLLTSYIADEYQNRDERSARELIGTAQLAIHLGSTHVKELVFEAAAKVDADSSVFAAAYFIATSAGWESDPKIFEWLEKAAEMSGDDGPLQRMSLKDVFDLKPEWDRRESDTWRQLSEGKVSIVLAAQSLNRSFLELTVVSALANLNESDPRRRSTIPAYSGRQVPLELDISGKAVALDTTAILNLSFLNILDVVLDKIDTVYIPHSTLGWLFEERQRASFHQPSRIASARKLRDFVSSNALEEFNPSTKALSELSAQVGDELASLITEATDERNRDTTQSVVVRPAPVHRLSSLMDEEADLSKYAKIMGSCLSVVRKMRQKGAITAAEEKRAEAYLQLHEKPWPGQPDISNDALLYLDSLAVSYFSHLGLLGKMEVAGLRAVLSPNALSDADALISFDSISEEVQDMIERIRVSLNTRILSGQISVGRKQKIDQSDQKNILGHPSISILELASKCDVAIIDDRFFNQHTFFENGGSSISIYSSLDLLEALKDNCVITDDELIEHRSKLRRAGLYFVPVSASELQRCLGDAAIGEQGVVETAELRTIRESILLIRMRDLLKSQSDMHWLEVVIKTFSQVLRMQWMDAANINEITARSNWLANQIDVRGWAHGYSSDITEDMALDKKMTNLLFLLVPPVNVKPEVVEAYWNWVEYRFLAPIREQDPLLYERLTQYYRKRVADVANKSLSELSRS